MDSSLANRHYNSIMHSSSNNQELLSKYQAVNDFLKQNDWLFISPLFFQGFELSSIFKLIGTKDEVKQQILNIICRKFYNLPITASFAEGYCIRCNHIKPFVISIEHSLILTFQKDYEGAIKTIIPIIEGIIRKYLVEEKGAVMHEIQFQKIRTSFDLLKGDLLLNYREFLNNYKTQNNESVTFSEAQISQMMAKETHYLNIWFSFVSDFVNNSFYLRTTNNKLTNEVNRHSIMHELGNNFDYNFENYIKIYFLLQFLTWAFLKKEQRSLLDSMDGYRSFEKVMAYDSIIKQSERISYEKHILFRKYDNYLEHPLKEKSPKPTLFILPAKTMIKQNWFTRINKYLWHRGFNAMSDNGNLSKNSEQ
jgi:hypothetical protein